jgi:hypothetical protein
MALWGNNDAVGAAGTVILNYATGVVTGAGTSFGIAGGCSEGDVIRFGDRSGTYYGDAVIISIASSESLTIGSTAGLSGVAIAGTTFTVSQLPKYTVLDSSFGTKNDTAPTLSPFQTGTATTNASVGSNTVPVLTTGLGLVVGDTVLNGSDNILISSIGTAVAAATTNAGIGTDIIPVIAPAGTLIGDSLTNDGNLLAISSINATTVSLASTISAGISTGDSLTFTGVNLIGLASTIGTGIGTGDSITFKRYFDGYDRYVYGVAEGGMTAATGTSYALTHEGWVGVTTYMGVEGELRVKTETLVAMSGITTGNAPLFPPA